MTLYVERETYRDDIIIMEHLHQATQTHTKQHVWNNVKDLSVIIH